MGKAQDKKVAESGQNLSINDENWTAFLFTVYLDAGTPDANASKLSQLGEWMSSGHRQRFTTVTREEIGIWATENSKYSDACKDLKVALDSGNVSDLVMARAFKAWLLAKKEEALEIKLGKSKDIPAQQDDPKKSKESPASAAGKKPAAPAAAAPPPAKGGKGTETATVGSAGTDKKKGKLRDRTGGPQKDRIVSVGDEPLDGPDVYYYLQDLDTPGFISAFNEETDIGLDAVFRGQYEPSDLVPKKGEKERTEDQVINASWQSIKNKSKTSGEEFWRKTGWELMKNTDFKEVKDAFEIIARKIYNLLDRKKTYASFYKHDKILNVPLIDGKGTDLRYYEYLTSMANSKGVTSIEIILALVLEFLSRQTPLEENTPAYNDQVEYNIGSLKQFFDTEFARVGLDSVTKQSNESESKKTQSKIMIEYADTTGLQSYFMKTLHSINLNPVELVTKIQERFPSAKYVDFLQKIPEFKNLIPSQVLAESLKYQTEFWKHTSVKDLDSVRLENLFVQLEFEKMTLDKLAPSMKSFSLNDWKWFGAMSWPSAVQAIQDAKILRPEAHYHFSPLLGKLLLLLKSPGPIGCLEHHTTQTIYARPKVGFSVFNEQYNPATNSLGKEKASSANGNANISYDMKDKSVAITRDISYLYPANNIIIQVTKQNSSLGKDITTKISTGENTIHFSGTDQSRSKNAFFTGRFNDESVFSMTSKDGQLTIKFCDNDGNHYTLGRDGSIICESFATAPVTTSSKNKEIKRVFLSSGVVIKHYESKIIQVLFPDGSTATKSPGSDWVKISREGTPVQKNGVESKLYNDDVEISRDDFVTVSKIDDAIVTEHSCSTTIKTRLARNTTVSSPGIATVFFESSGKQIIVVSDNYVVERVFSEGVTSSIKVKRSDLNIDMLSSGDISVKLLDFGFTTPLLSDRNSMKINWMQGTLALKDICGYEFNVTELGGTSITKPSTSEAVPEFTFGGKLIKEALRSSSFDHTLGNSPSFFVLSPDGQNSFLLQRDIDQLRHIQSYQHKIHKVLEDVGGIPGSITLCITTKNKLSNSTEDVIQYIQFLRFKDINPSQKSIASKEYIELLEKVRVRNATMPNSQLGETKGAFLEETLNQTPFVYGMNKEATQLAILQKYLEKEDLGADPGLNTNTHMQRLLANAKSSVKKVIAPVQIASTEKARPSRRKPATYKVPKYFDSPEGKAYLASNPPVIKEVPQPNDVPRNQNAVKPEILLSENNFVPESAIAAEVPVLASTDIINVSQIITGVAPVDSQQPNEDKKKPHETKAPKVRKLKLPASILGAKPGAIPNTVYLNQEKDVKRKLNTVSTALTKNQEVGFILLPSKCNFGSVKTTDSPPSVTLDMTNVGLDSCRFKIKQSPESMLQVKYKHGPVAPGMSVKFTITLLPGTEAKQLEEEIKIISELEILHIPVKATIVKGRDD